MESREGVASAWRETSTRGGRREHLQCSKPRGDLHRPPTHPQQPADLPSSTCVLIRVCLIYVSVQPDDDENRDELEEEEGGISFFAHVPVPSQKEVRFHVVK